MDILAGQHRVAGYRGAAVRCPGCAEPMSIENLADAEVDVCNACGGMWIDWFDGEIKRVASAVVASEPERISRPSVESSSLRNEAFATGACPRCTRQLVIERYVVRADVGTRSSGERTSNSCSFFPARFTSCTLTCGTVSMGRPALFQLFIPPARYPANFV